MAAMIDRTGRRYGRLVVVKYAGRGSSEKIQWLCRCDCGAETTVKGASLQSGQTKSCGCLHSEAAANNGRSAFLVLNALDEYKEKLRKHGSSVLRSLNSDPEFSAARNLRLAKLNSDPKFKERQRTAASAALAKLHKDPEFAARRDERTSTRHQYNDFMRRMEQEEAELAAAQGK